MKVRSYRELKVWQHSLKLAEEIYHLTEKFPKYETYALSNQMQRAAVSVPCNIAEGHARESTKEFLNYVSIALGSLAELETQLILAERLSYVGNKDLEMTFSEMDELGKMLRGVQKSLRAKLPILQPLAPSP
jgi:four helix bundle protein